MSEYVNAVAAIFSALASFTSLGLVVRVNNTDTVKLLRHEKRELLYGRPREQTMITMESREYPGEQVKGYFRRWEALLEDIEVYRASRWYWFGPKFEINKTETGYAAELYCHYKKMKQIHQHKKNWSSSTKWTMPGDNNLGEWDPSEDDKFAKLTKS
jgi:hypothetical protein